MPEENENTGMGTEQGDAGLGDTGMNQSEMPSDDTGIEESGMPPETGEEETPALDDESKAFRKAWEDERSKRQALERQMSTYDGILNQFKQPQQPQYDPEDFPNFNQVNQVVGERVSQASSDIKGALFDMSVKIAMKNHEDYTKVVPLAIDLADRDPATREYILNSKDPGETAYMIGKTHPDYEKIRTADATKKVTSQIKSNSKKAQTLSNTGASGKSQLSAAQVIEEMSPEDFDVHIEKVKDGR